MRVVKHIRFNLLTFITVFVGLFGVQYKAPAIDSLAEQKALAEIEEAYPMPVPKKL